MTPIDISIIIPMYNAEQYVKQCLDRIFCSDIGNVNLEIVVIDDGSTDHSLELVRSYSNIPNLKLLSGKNEGVAAARNKGIRYASGKYILLVDVDDFIDTTKLDECVTKANLYEVEILIFDYNLTHESGRTERKNLFLNLPQEEKLYIGKEVLKSFYGYDGYMWMAMYNRDFIVANNFFFEESLKIWEDLDLIQKILLQAKRVVYLQESVYHYIRHRNSLSGIASVEKTENSLKVLNSLKERKDILPDDLKMYNEKLYSYHLYRTIKHILRAHFSRQQTQALFTIIESKRMLPLYIDGTLKERLDKKLLNASLTCFAFLFCLKKGLFFRKSN